MQALKIWCAFSSWCVATAGQAPAVSIFPGEGLRDSDYADLKEALQKTSLPSAAVQRAYLTDASGTAELCVAHSTAGAAAALVAASHAQRCTAGVVALSATLSSDELRNVAKPMLVIIDDAGAAVPISQIAISRHRSAGAPVRYAALSGASRLAGTGGDSSRRLVTMNLAGRVEQRVATLVQGFMDGDVDAAAVLKAAERRLSALAAPLVKALELEGSSALGHPACNSDFPTNRLCNYPKWPDHSLPFGPAPAPNPLPPSDCICGSPWVMDTAALLYDLPAVTSFTKDAFHVMSDTHPFHLPNHFNTCDKPASCVLNMTTVTEPLLDGSSWPAGAAEPTSFYELKTKFKSLQAVRVAAGVPGAHTDGSPDRGDGHCQRINQAALDWALEHAEESVKTSYLAKGEPLVIVPDKKSGYSLRGPTWITDKLVFARVDNASSPTGTAMTVQSWAFVVADPFDGHQPWWTPLGMHYCKLLSPARAMEWIYAQGLGRREAQV